MKSMSHMSLMRTIPLVVLNFASLAASARELVAEVANGVDLIFFYFYFIYM